MDNSDFWKEAKSEEDKPLDLSIEGLKISVEEHASAEQPLRSFWGEWNILVKFPDGGGKKFDSLQDFHANVVSGVKIYTRGSANLESLRGELRTHFSVWVEVLENTLNALQRLGSKTVVSPARGGELLTVNTGNVVKFLVQRKFLKTRSKTASSVFGHVTTQWAVDMDPLAEAGWRKILLAAVNDGLLEETTPKINVPWASLDRGPRWTFPIGGRSTPPQRYSFPQLLKKFHEFSSVKEDVVGGADDADEAASTLTGQLVTCDPVVVDPASGAVGESESWKSPGGKVLGSPGSGLLALKRGHKVRALLQVWPRGGEVVEAGTRGEIMDVDEDQGKGGRGWKVLVRFEEGPRPREVWVSRAELSKLQRDDMTWEEVKTALPLKVPEPLACCIGREAAQCH